MILSIQIKSLVFSFFYGVLFYFSHVFFLQQRRNLRQKMKRQYKIYFFIRTFSGISRDNRFHFSCIDGSVTFPGKAQEDNFSAVS